MAIQDSAFPLREAALFSDEPQHDNVDTEYSDASRNASRAASLVVVNEEDLRWDDEELAMLLSREAEERMMGLTKDVEEAGVVAAGFGFIRWEAVAWMMRVVAHYGFTATTAVLAVDYIDHFMVRHHFRISQASVQA